MKNLILVLILAVLSLSATCQVKPTNPEFKLEQTPYNKVWGFNKLDSTQWGYSGYSGWQKFFTAKTIQAKLDSLSSVKENTLTKGDLTESIGGLQFSANRQVIGGATDLQLSSGYFIPTTTEQTTWNAKQNAITLGTTAQYFRGDLSLGTMPEGSKWTEDTYGINYTVANVGIGNYSNPAYKLKIESNISSGYAASFSNASTSGNGMRVLSAASTDNGDVASFWGNGLDWVSITAAGTINIRGRASAPLSPGSPYGRLYALTDGKLYWKNSTGTEYDLTASGGGSGTVTSVAMTVPTGLSITGSPITTSGTLAVGLQSGYSIPTTANQTNWGTAYTNMGKASINSSGTYNYLDPDYFTVTSSLIQPIVSPLIDVDSGLPVQSSAIYNALLLKQNAITLTTIGTSGAATLTGSTLNIPQYTGGSGTNYWQPLTGAIAPATITDEVRLSSTTDYGAYKLQLNGKIFIGDYSFATIFEQSSGDFMMKYDNDGSEPTQFYKYEWVTDVTNLSSIVKVIPRPSAPSSPSDGWIYVNSTDHHIYVYLNGAWKQMDN